MWRSERKVAGRHAGEERKRHVWLGLSSDTAEYFHQTTLQLPTGDTTQQQRQSVTGSQAMFTTTNTTTTTTGATCSGDVVINIDEKQPLICRSDQLLTIDTVPLRTIHHLTIRSILGRVRTTDRS